jgi:uncharacterized membrane protein
MLKQPLLFLLLFHLLLYVVVLLNIPVIRQIAVFIFLSFIPGFVLLKLLKLTETFIVKKILFAVGLSLAFLMLTGLLINELFFALGISTPLLSTPLLISISFLTLVLSFIAYRQDLIVNLKLIENSFNLKDVVPKSIIILPLILGIVGSVYTNVIILSLMVISIVILCSISIFSHKFFSIKSLSVVLFIISLTLLIQVVLTSKYIMGADANTEYYVFKLTANSGHWAVLSTVINSIPTVNYSSMLSVTILPTIYYSLMNTSGEAVFKSLYPFVFSLVPVALFTIYSKQFGKTASFLSVLFFVSGLPVFFGIEPLSLNKQIVGTFFLVLSILITLDKSLPIGKRRILLIVFGVALILSHYSLTLIYLFFVLGLYIFSRAKKYQDSIFDFKVVAILFIMTFLWFSYSNSLIVSIASSLNHIFSNIVSDFGNITSRVGVLSGSHPSFGSNVNFAGDVNWSFLILANLFLAIGLLGLLVNKLVKTKKWSIDPQYQTLCFLSGFILILCLAIPNLAPSLNFTRFYAITLLFLSPCFVMGGELVVDIAGTLWKKIAIRRFLVTNKRVTKILLCIVLFGYFLSQSGFVNIIAGAVPLSYPLDYTRGSTWPDRSIQVGFSEAYIPEQDVFSASWLLKNKVETVEVFGDISSVGHVLVSYGLIPSNLLLPITNSTIPTQGSFIYLNSLNIVDGVIDTFTGSLNTSEISFLLDENNLVYSNGDSEIWLVTH